MISSVKNSSQFNKFKNQVLIIRITPNNNHLVYIYNIKIYIFRNLFLNLHI